MTHKIKADALKVGDQVILPADWPDKGDPRIEVIIDGIEGNSAYGRVASEGFDYTTWSNTLDSYETWGDQV